MLPPAGHRRRLRAQTPGPGRRCRQEGTGGQGAAAAAARHRGHGAPAGRTAGAQMMQQAGRHAAARGRRPREAVAATSRPTCASTPRRPARCANARQQAGAGTSAPMLEEKFTEDELKQLIAIIESPVNRKYQAWAEMQKAWREAGGRDSSRWSSPSCAGLQQVVGGRAWRLPRSRRGTAAKDASEAASSPCRPGRRPALLACASASTPSTASCWRC
jgi:hypothetical protein